MKTTAPDWLDKLGKTLWLRLCQCYADYRSAPDLQTRTKYLDFFLNNGLATLNQCLADLNMPSAGADGDRYRMPVNISFVDILGDPKDEPSTDVPNPSAELVAGADTGQAEPNVLDNAKVL